MSTVYQDGVTPLDASHLNALQQKAEKGAPSGYAPLDAGSKVPVANLPDLSGTYQPLSQKNQPSGYVGLSASSQIVFQGDASANLYRSAAGTLKTDGTLIVGNGGNVYGNSNVWVAGDAQPRVILAPNYSGGNPGLVFGPGLSGGDTNLYRYSANVLQSDSCLRLSGTGAAVGATGVSGLLLNFLNVVSGWVQVGDPDSAGSGFRVLRVSN